MSDARTPSNERPYDAAPPWIPRDDGILSVTDLRVDIARGTRVTTVIDGATFGLAEGGALGIVGESGSGKSMLSRTIVGTISRYGGVVRSGSVRLFGRETAHYRDRDWRAIRGREVAFVPQSSMAGLNPVLTVGTQLDEVLRTEGLTPQQRRARAIELLELVQIARAPRVVDEMPSQLSGGMRQRVVIATALARNPRLLVLDEPTTALDVTVQAEILRLIGELRSTLGMAILLTSHDLAVVEQVCDDVMTMYAGSVVEIGSSDRLVAGASHPYTRALLSSRVEGTPPGQDIVTIPGEPPTAGHWPSGCRFRTRCPLAIDACAVGRQPELRVLGGGGSACIRTGEAS
jgi:oligopeptide/dipeptide ABC transporter, ATP-binding protein, C-terminal domain